MDNKETKKKLYNSLENFFFYLLTVILSPILAFIPSLPVWLVYNNIFVKNFDIINLSFFEIWGIFIILIITINLFRK